MTNLSEIKAICIEAFETVKRMPGSVGPSFKLRIWPDMQGETNKDYAPEKTPIRVYPTAHQISEAEKFFDAVNRLESQHDRDMIRQWGWIKTTRGLTIGYEAKKLGFLEHQYRREINEIFQKVIVHFHINNGVMLSTDVEQCEEMEDKRSTSHEARRRGTIGKYAWSQSPTPRQMITEILARTNRKSEKRVGA